MGATKPEARSPRSLAGSGPQSWIRALWSVHSSPSWEHVLCCSFLRAARSRSMSAVWKLSTKNAPRTRAARSSSWCCCFKMGPQNSRLGQNRAMALACVYDSQTPHGPRGLWFSNSFVWKGISLLTTRNLHATATFQGPRKIRSRLQRQMQTQMDIQPALDKHSPKHPANGPNQRFTNPCQEVKKWWTTKCTKRGLMLFRLISLKKHFIANKETTSCYCYIPRSSKDHKPSSKANGHTTSSCRTSSNHQCAFGVSGILSLEPCIGTKQWEEDKRHWQCLSSRICQEVHLSFSRDGGIG